MSERIKTTANPFSATIILSILAISLIAFAAVVVLSAWAPELRDRNKAGMHPFSTSALGYNGLFQLLESQGQQVSISRAPRLLEERYEGLMIITLSPYGMKSDLEDISLTGPSLIVLPKWTGRTSAMNPRKQVDTQFAQARSLNDLIQIYDGNAEIGRIDLPGKVETPFGAHAPEPDIKLQIIRSDELVTIVEAGDGALLAKLPYQDTYILSDPDMLNTFGLARLENARFTTAMINWMQYDPAEPIILDATLHGFARTENPLKMAFDIPFIGATLTALAALLMLGWAASVRFGSPERETRIFALGKQALSENSAGLITMARRETRMAPGYLAMTRKRVAKDIGAPKTLTEEQLSALFERLSAEAPGDKTWNEIARGLSGPATSREDLMNKARDLYRWRKKITGRT